jgi:ABC-2 type transport system permease protein
MELRNAGIIAGRELKSFFISPVAYAVGFFFLLILGAWFYFIALAANDVNASLTGTLNVLSYLTIPTAAVITMHLFADERRSGTIELLMTYPLSDWQVVLGKYLASLVLFAFVLALTLQYPLFLIIYGKPDLGTVFTGYLGAFLLGASFVAMGVLASSLTRSSVVAAIITLLVLMGLQLMTAGAVIGGPVGRVFHYLSFAGHFENFSAGLIDTRDLIYMLTFIIFTLFASVRVIEINRWK